MARRPFSTLALVALPLGILTSTASAQPLGTFRWQLQPYCNIVTVNVVQSGGVYTLDGWDDQCQWMGGLAPRAPLVGTATLNPDGTIGLGLQIVTAPAGGTVHVSASLVLPSLTGSWRDSTGLGGTLLPTSGAGVPAASRPDAHVHPGPERSNTRIGLRALAVNLSGSDNTVIGNYSMEDNITGNRNVAVGYGLANNISGSGNIAIGSAAMFYNTAGNENIALGYNALTYNTSGNFNIAIGFASGLGVTSGQRNIYLGEYVTAASPDESNTMRIGTGTLPGRALTRSFIGGIRGATTGSDDAVPVVIDSAGQLGTLSSSRTKKDHIADLGAVSRRIFDLRPVQFTYRQPFADGTTPVQYGLIAEEVATVLPSLVAHGLDGSTETVKYHVLPILMLAEMQRLERERAALTQQVRMLREQAELSNRRLAALEARLGHPR